MTSRQLGFWQDSTTLFRHALAVTEDNWAAHTYLGFALSKSPAHLSEAIAEYQAGLADRARGLGGPQLPGDRAGENTGPRIRSDRRVSVGAASQSQDRGRAQQSCYRPGENAGRLPDAIAEYQAALRLTPESAEIHYNLGLALAKTPGRLPEAITEFQAAVRLQPDSAEMHYNLARVLAETPALPEAITEYQTVLRIRPDYAEAHYGLGLVLARIPGHLPEAIAEYQAALRLRPDDAKAHNALGNAWSEMPDRLPEAVAEFQAALRLQPDFVEVHNNLGIALAQLPGRLPEAIAEYETVLRAKPDFAEAHFNLGIALARDSRPAARGDCRIRSRLARPAWISLRRTTIWRTPWRGLPAGQPRRSPSTRPRSGSNPTSSRPISTWGSSCRAFPGRQSEAIGHFESALQIKPGFELRRARCSSNCAPPHDRPDTWCPFVSISGFCLEAIRKPMGEPDSRGAILSRPRRRAQRACAPTFIRGFRLASCQIHFQNELRRRARVDLSSPVGKKPLTRKEDPPTTQVSAPLDASIARTLPIVDQEGQRRAGPPAAQDKDVRFLGPWPGAAAGPAALPAGGGGLFARAAARLHPLR